MATIRDAFSENEEYHVLKELAKKVIIYKRGRYIFLNLTLCIRNAFLNIRNKKAEDYGFGLNRERLSNLALTCNVFLSKLQSPNQFTMPVTVNELAKDRL